MKLALCEPVCVIVELGVRVSELEAVALALCVRLDDADWLPVLDALGELLWLRDCVEVCDEERVELFVPDDICEPDCEGLPLHDGDAEIVRVCDSL